MRRCGRPEHNPLHEPEDIGSGQDHAQCGEAVAN